MKKVPLPKLVPADVTGQKLNIQNCFACDGSHQGVEIHTFATAANQPWTHWYQCPTCGDPVPLMLVQRKAKLVEVDNAIIHQLVEAQESGRYMVAIFRPGGQLQLARTTQNFPIDQFSDAVGELQRNLDREVGPPEQKPLERAAPAPLVNLFNEAAEGAAEKAEPPAEPEPATPASTEPPAAIINLFGSPAK